MRHTALVKHRCPDPRPHHVCCIMSLGFDDDRPLEDWEYPDPDDFDGDDDTPTITCAACGAEIYDDTPQCPACGEYVLAGRRSHWDGRPAWWIALGLLGIIAVIYLLAEF